MTWSIRSGRSVETVQAELRAIESRTNSKTDPALHAHADYLRQEHQEARRARQREFEDDLMLMPQGARQVFAPRAGGQPPLDAG